MNMAAEREGTGARLVIFSASFPYGSGEQFLETEIRYLARAFPRLSLVPSTARGRPRVLPDGVTVDSSLASNKAGRLRRAVRSVFQLFGSAGLHREIASQWRHLWHPRASRRFFATFDHSLRVEDWIQNALLDGRVDCTSTLYTYWLGGTTLGAVRARRQAPGLRVVSRAHGLDLYDERHHPPYLPFRGSIFAGVDQVYAVSEYGAAYLRQRWPAFVHKIAVARLGVADPGCNARVSDDGGYRVVSCSFLEPVKRVELLIDALVLLADSLGDVSIHWTHIGDGSLGARIRTYASQRLRKRVDYTFVGALGNAEVLDFYRYNPVDVFVNVSESEGIPVSIMEAQSFGIPVVATAVGGTPEIVSPENGLLLPANPTPVAVAEGLLAAFLWAENGERRSRSKEMWRERFNAERNYAAFVLGLRRPNDAAAAVGTV